MTYTLRNGEIVTAKTAGWPTQYTNRTQAQRAADQIPGADVIQRGRPFYVRVGVTTRGACGQPIDAAVVAPCERVSGHAGPCRAYTLEH